MAKKKKTSVKVGDRVQWGTSQGKTTGKVTKKVTSTKKIKGYTARGTKAEPQLEVQSEKTGKKAIHKPGSLHKVAKSKTATKKSSASGTTAGGKTKRKSKKARSKRTSKKGGSKSEGGKRGETIREFKKVVNMSAAKLEKWLGTEDSKGVGWSSSGRGESVGHHSGRKIIRLLGKKSDELETSDLAHMRKVVGYVHRHKAQRPAGDVSETPWRYSLMNWGHDPARK